MNVGMLKKNTSIMREEIFSQSTILKHSYTVNKEKIVKIAEKIRQYHPSIFYFAARGSSEHACVLAKYILEIYGGTPAMLINPSVITLYNSNLDLGNSVIIGVSQSGGAEDVARVLAHGRKKGAITIGITNCEGVVDKEVDYNIANNIGNEIALPATKSYMSQAFLLLAILAHVTENQELFTALDKIPDALDAGIALDSEIQKYAYCFCRNEYITIISRGITHAAMLEAELKIQETSNINARAYAASDYAHGPFSLTNYSQLYFFTLVDSITDSFTLEMFKRMSEKSICSLAITNKPEIAKKFPLSLVLPEWCEGITGVFASVVLFQLFACHFAVYRGKNPDVPEGVSKTVVTV